MIRYVEAAGAIAPSAASVRMVQAMITRRVVVVSLAVCWTELSHTTLSPYLTVYPFL